MSQIIWKLHSIGKTTALTLLLPIVFDLINNTMNDSDAVWRWVHWKYVMSQIIPKLHSIRGGGCWSYLFLPTMPNIIEETMNEIDSVWRLLHRKYVMSQIIWKLYSIRENNCSCLAVTGDILLNQWNNESEWWSMTMIA